MKKTKLWGLTAAFVIAGLASGNIYYWNESKKPDTMIRIGNPVSSERVNYSNPITNKEHAREITHSLIQAVSISRPAVAESLPDARVMIDDWQIGVTYLVADAWFDEDKVIFALGGEDTLREAEYKELTGSWAECVKEILEEYQV